MHLDDLPPKARAQALAQIEADKLRRHPVQFIHPMQNPHQTSKPRLRQKREGLNKTEAAFLEYIKGEFDGVKIRSQEYTLKLGNGVRYTPDFSVLFDDGLCFYEVKGFMRDDAAVKIKVAASLYPEHAFFLATRKKGQWDIQEVLA